MNENNTIIRATGLALIATAIAGAALFGNAVAHAEPATIDLRDLPGIDSMPVCQMEDGSDVPAELLPCIWGNDGNAWLTYADHSVLIVDVT